ncbi:helix-turn-helix transcriptional regulator [Treponema sp. OMZ 840]|uniref:helix-turn-helix domain-containing protein n=1 Tax=Treponema sp. OMZ 840 TaxID=244313 RepID=UPI003D8EF4B7
MQKNYHAFLSYTNSVIVKKDNPYPHFKTYAFSSEIGRGSLALYDVGSYAHICIADHLYYRDFKYTLRTEEGIYFQQYDSIASDTTYPSGRVYAGMQYLEHYTKAETVQYVIKKETPARVIGVHLTPEYYGAYLKDSFGITQEAFCAKIALLPKENYIPEISFILNQIQKFSGTAASAKLFFKSKTDEIAALLLQKTETLQEAKHTVTASDHAAIMQTAEYIRNNVHKKLPLETLAKMSYMGPSKFKYVFKAVTGFSLTDYIFNKKMEAACDMLLNTHLYAANIAQRLGYRNTGYFSARFKEYSGMPPNEYRKKR